MYTSMCTDVCYARESSVFLSVRVPECSWSCVRVWSLVCADTCMSVVVNVCVRVYKCIHTIVWVRECTCVRVSVYVGASVHVCDAMYVRVHVCADGPRPLCFVTSVVSCFLYSFSGFHSGRHLPCTRVVPGVKDVVPVVRSGRGSDKGLYRLRELDHAGVPVYSSVARGPASRGVFSVAYLGRCVSPA